MYFLSKTMSNLFSNPKAKFISNPKVKLKHTQSIFFPNLMKNYSNTRQKNKFKKMIFLVLPIYVINFLKIIGCYYKFKTLFF